MAEMLRANAELMKPQTESLSRDRGSRRNSSSNPELVSPGKRCEEATQDARPNDRASIVTDDAAARQSSRMPLSPMD